MPQKAMKAAKSSNWPAPKTGKARAQKKPAAVMKKFNKIPYVRHGTLSTPYRRERVRWGRSVQKFLKMSTPSLIRLLTKDRILPHWKTCPHCGADGLKPLKYFPQKDVYAYRCSKKKCMKRIQPQDFHPIFCSGRNSKTSLQMQAAILYCGVVPLSPPTTSNGLVERGRPSSLILFRLALRMTKKRAPGPGPIRKRDWRPIAQRHLAGKGVILHTDGARAYKMKLAQVIHCNVVHQKKKTNVNGKARFLAKFI